jgi:glycosyltransferase involved in cell wall biosynthesis
MQVPTRPDPPLLSTVVPFLNEAANPPRLIASLEITLQQLGLPWELVLVDDGSRDDSLAVGFAASWSKGPSCGAPC